MEKKVRKGITEKHWESKVSRGHPKSAILIKILLTLFAPGGRGDLLQKERHQENGVGGGGCHGLAYSFTLLTTGKEKHCKVGGGCPKLKKKPVEVLVEQIQAESADPQ